MKHLVLAKNTLHGFPIFLHPSLVFELFFYEPLEEPLSMQCTPQKHILSLPMLLSHCISICPHLLFSHLLWPPGSR